MTKYLFIFHGGRLPEPQDDHDAIMATWGAWMSGLGDTMLDPGSMISATSHVTTSGVSSMNDTDAPSGYMIVSAQAPEEAVEMAKTCPIHAGGGTVDVATVV
ncbi:hypothetical protein [Yoonia sediminilitoris]|uniref:YCII-related domain-containing protein n=1 Tax=Yoonia sediminilitoris TaxID=1286148 RepID=A0A2T6K582_9RHOB|nr:hypothetical protein [Yoonia sediminilitoris]PUB09781.1 hypothetical protein C8N45_1252 [Yoonia sediminilitoris]RCW89561.1 hypothetical protein DFP92_1252 [Yoonia sediminilitoris]